jgi:TM2 domain-containing membrane protein YozV
MVHMVHIPVWLIIAAIKLAWLGSMGIEHFYLGGSVWAFGRPFFVG